MSQASGFSSVPNAGNRLAKTIPTTSTAAPGKPENIETENLIAVRSGWASATTTDAPTLKHGYETADATRLRPNQNPNPKSANPATALGSGIEVVDEISSSGRCEVVCSV